jgi:hypothetical protein
MMFSAKYRKNVSKLQERKPAEPMQVPQAINPV